MQMLALRILLPLATSSVTEPAPRYLCQNDGLISLPATRYVTDNGQAGDPVEVEAASSVLCGVRDREPLIIGSVRLHLHFPLNLMLRLALLTSSINLRSRVISDIQSVLLVYRVS